MSRDSTATYVHSHASHHADLFEDFCHPPSSTTASNSHNSNGTSNTQPNPNSAQPGNDPSMVQIPGHFLPFEEIQLPPHLMPLNPEDEDDVVPDMHAAFGITRALNGIGGSNVVHTSGEGSGRGAQQEPIWRDLGLERIFEGGGHATSQTDAGISTARREGKKSGLLLMR